MSNLGPVFINDERGQHPASWYAQSASIPAAQPALRGDVRKDVCVIGGGYTGLSSALHLAKSGYSVALLEANRVGFGASGRNGGQLGSGQNPDQITLERRYGTDLAHQLWHLGQEAQNLVKSLIGSYAIECALTAGLAWTAHHRRDVEQLHRYAAHMSEHYSHKLDIVHAEAFREICPSPAYHGGVIDMSGGHLHPLRFALGLAKVALQLGAVIFEDTPAIKITPAKRVLVDTSHGRIEADHLIMACNGYLGRLGAGLEGGGPSPYVLPINNFIAATQPLGPKIHSVLTRDIAICDEKFVVNYFRRSEDGRLLFGGGESYRAAFPDNIEGTVRRAMQSIFPQLKDVEIDYAWGGTLAITRSRLPYFARHGHNILSASGYSGHGIGMATLAGKLMAQTIQGQSNGFNVIANLEQRPFPGPPALRPALSTLGMLWYRMRDALGA